MAAKRKPTCECADKGCSAHEGISHCINKSVVEVRRIDYDGAKVRFCEDCWNDAIESGVFDSEEEEEDDDESDEA